MGLEFSGGVGPMRVAVIGSGISGMSAAWLASKSCEVTIYEAEDRIGGHSNTVTVDVDEGRVPVDTGFIVYNERNYPNLVALFDHLGVASEATNMSFAASLDDGAFEYSGTGIGGLLGQRRNAARPRFWRMVSDVVRFYRDAPQLLQRRDLDGLSLGEFLVREAYSQAFIDDHLLPMGAAIWSATAKDMRDYPLTAFLRFFINHGLVQLKDRPQWRTVTGGSVEYVRRLMGDFQGEIRLKSRVTEVRSEGGRVIVRDSSGNADRFDQVILATHADDALAVLADADRRERDVLGRFNYTRNQAVLHCDRSLMPKRKQVWSSWNYIGAKASGEDRQLCVTYWMNRLQNLETSRPLFVTLNPCRTIAEEHVIRTFDYKHPLFDAAALQAQRQIWDLQGRRGVWFCGAHFGSGFHEDGLQAGLAVAERLTGNQRPWKLAEPSGRIFVPEMLEAAE